MGHYELLLHTQIKAVTRWSKDKKQYKPQRTKWLKKKSSQTSKQWGPFDRECTLTNNYTPVSQKSYVY